MFNNANKPVATTMMAMILCLSVFMGSDVT
jgi:hypothetical protein